MAQALPVVTLAKGGVPVTVVTSVFYGMPVDEALNGKGLAVTQVPVFGLPVIYGIGGGPGPDPGGGLLLLRAGGYILMRDGVSRVQLGH